VIVLNLNGREHLGRCFESLGAIEYPKEKLEVVLIDNGSADGSADEIKRTHPWVRVVENARNVGFSAGCNQGVRLAATPPVAVFLNNDMRVDSRWLAELVAPIVRGECAATTSKMLSWDGMKIDSAGGGMNFAGIGIQYGFDEEPGPAFDFPRRTLFACGGSMAIDARTMLDLGGFDEEFFAYYEDVDLGWRLWIAGHECRYVPTSVAYHRHSGTSNRIPRELIRVLQLRNPMLACVKNYDDENLARVLAPLLGLALRRIKLIAEIEDEKSFRIEAAPSSFLGVQLSLLDRAKRKLDDRVGIKRRAVADILAADDLLSNWNHWMERRAEVQATRKRPDAEILRLFLKPYWCTEPNDSFCELQTGLLRFAGLDRVLPPDAIPDPNW
jgi:GT2 family glycosyltransferase